jgi:hypothetical protein
MKAKRARDLGHTYDWHVVMGIRNKRFNTKESAVAKIRNIETEWKSFGGWIISGPGVDGMFRVFQGSVAFEDIAELLSNDCAFLYRHGQLIDLKKDLED